MGFGIYIYFHLERLVSTVFASRYRISNLCSFWFANSRFYKNNNEVSIEWSGILHKLLSKSNKPQTHLSVIMKPLFEMYSCSGRPSRALTKRLPFFESLKEYLIRHDKADLVPIVEDRTLEFQKYIEQAQQEEAKDLREQQGFEW